MAFFPVLAGIVTGSVTVPFEQGTVAGSPGMAGEDENVQLVALATVADRVTDPPAEVTDEGMTVGVDTIGAGAAATESLTVLVVVVEVVPVATRVKVYLTALLVALAGTVTSWSTVPLEHATVAGSPLIAGVDEKVQLVALATVADRTIDPPDEVSDEGVATSEETVGFVDWDEAPAGRAMPTMVTPTIRASTALTLAARNPMSGDRRWRLEDPFRD
jgi:hypothetical protein